VSRNDLGQLTLTRRSSWLPSSFAVVRLCTYRLSLSWTTHLIPSGRADIGGGGRDLRRYGQGNEEHTNQRNGYRPREWDTRAGTIELAIPKSRCGSYFLDCLLQHRPRAEQALVNVVVPAMGMSRAVPAEGPSSPRTASSPPPRRAVGRSHPPQHPRCRPGVSRYEPSALAQESRAD
jgi:hypothetical protein